MPQEVLGHGAKHTPQSDPTVGVGRLLGVGELIPWLCVCVHS